MQRSKQQALMFLLGAVLVGGVLGFSADRVMTKKPMRVSARVQMYDDIGIDSTQRVKMDSILDETNCKTSEIMRSVRPTMDSIRAEGLGTILGMMSAEQRAAYDLREKRFKARMDSLEKERDAKWAKEHPGSERSRRCGAFKQGSTPAAPGLPAPTPASTGERRAPGGALFH